MKKAQTPRKTLAPGIARVLAGGQELADGRNVYPSQRPVEDSLPAVDKVGKTIDPIDAGLQRFSVRPYHPVRHRSNAYDHEREDENRKWTSSVRAEKVYSMVLLVFLIISGLHHQDAPIATEPRFDLPVRSEKGFS